jgi:hypothetical protein
MNDERRPEQGAADESGPGPERKRSARRLTQVTVVTTIYGQRALAVLPDVECDLYDPPPAEIQEGLQRRWTVDLGGECPCGARMVPPSREVRRHAKRKGERITPLRVEHEDDCPATNENLFPVTRAWLAGEIDG